MARKRSAFPTNEPRRETRPRRNSEVIDADDSTGGIFGFFRDFGVRETIESIIIAIVLAMLFKSFEAEAFIIPTGSMAPSLQGQHLDLECDQCDYRYRVGVRLENEKTLGTNCPICNYQTTLKPRDNKDHFSHSGDRILVNKFIYDFIEPKRYDVIVFKYPYNGKLNYIKRLIGLPGDNLLIENGDIYLMHEDGEGGFTREITRKPSHKLLHTITEVDDTDFIGSKLVGGKVMWPNRWNQYRGAGWTSVLVGGTPKCTSTETAETAWLRYRHNAPPADEGVWGEINNGKLPQLFDKPLDQLPAGRLITDYESYNDAKVRIRRPDGSTVVPLPRPGLHWVGDIGFEAWFESMSSAGEVAFDLVEGGAHFTLRVDIATGQGKLECSSSDVTFVDENGTAVATPTVATGIKGKGAHRIRYVNADDKIHLWVNNKLIDFKGSTYLRTGMPVPAYDPAGDAGDAEPCGIGATDVAMKVSRLKVLRDLYYTSEKGKNVGSLDNETGFDKSLILRIFNSPEQWSTPQALQLFTTKKNQTEPMFRLKKGENREQDQFLPMGDNSTSSSDARVWGDNHYVERDMLIGRGIFVYWPHTLNKPIPFFPNFGRMGFIR